MALFVLVLALPIAAATGLYGWYEHRGRQLAQSEPVLVAYANALKHAYGAGTTYQALRTIGVSDGLAHDATLQLGLLNEWLETFVKRGNKDDTAEMTIDLANNNLGVVAAKWAHGSDISLADALVCLARLHILTRRITELRPPGNVSEAWKGFSVARAGQEFLARSALDEKAENGCAIDRLSVSG